MAGRPVGVFQHLTSTPVPRRDGASYRMAAMWLTDAEFADLVRDLVTVFQPRLANPPAKGRRSSKRP